jgi:hypothetical protein
MSFKDYLKEYEGVTDAYDIKDGVSYKILYGKFENAMAKVEGVIDELVEFIEKTKYEDIIREKLRDRGLEDDTGKLTSDKEMKTWIIADVYNVFEVLGLDGKGN